MKIKNNYVASLVLLGAGLCLGSCGQENDPVDGAAKGEHISFAPYVEQTRARVADIETLKEEGFRVWIANNQGAEFSRENDNVGYLYNEEVFFSMYEDGFDYINKRFWPADDAKLSFFALANGGQYVSTTHTKAAAGAPVYTYTCPALFEEQRDVLAAQDLNKAKSVDAVRFNFEHMLSKIQFAVKSDVPANYTVSLKKVEVCYKSGAIYNQAAIDLNDMSVKPVEDATYTGGEGVSAGVVFDFEPGVELGGVEPISLIRPEGQDNVLMLVPQAYDEGDIYLKVSYDIDGRDDAHYDTRSSSEGPSFKESYTDVKIVLPTTMNESGGNIGWQKGKQYTYVLDITADAVTFGEVQVADWGAQSDSGVADVPVVRDIYYQNGVFHINTAEGLKVFADIVDHRNQKVIPGYTETNGVPNDNYLNGQLDSDIDLSTVCGASEALGSWRAIGQDYHFYGTFDGQDHYVDNLYINEPGRMYVALFCYLQENAVIKNVKVRGAYVEGLLCTAALVGYMEQSATITNCHVESDANHPVTIKSTKHYAGAMVSIMYSTAATDCSVHVNGGTMSISAVNNQQAGGFAGHANSCTFKNCSVRVSNGGQLDITASGDSAGGFVGHIHSTTFINCSVGSDDLTLSPINVTANNYYAGGFGGYAYMPTMVGCSSAVSKVASNNATDFAGYGIGYMANGTVSSSWAYCASAPTYDGYGYNVTTDKTVLYGTSPISYADNKAALDNSINNYNAGAPADKQAVPFNAQGAYGPIVSAVSTPLKN